MNNEIQRVFDSELEFDMDIGNEGVEKIDMGNGTIVEFHYSDVEEALIDKMAGIVFGMFSQDVYARSSPKTVTKKYGKRMCYDYFIIMCGVGEAT